SASKGDRDDERARLRILEEIETLRQEFSTTEVGLGVESFVLGPRVQVPAGDADLRAAESEAIANEGIVECVDERELAPLHEAPILDELRLHGARASTETGEPLLPLRERAERDLARAGTRDGFLRQHIVAEDARVARADIRF